MNDIDLLIFGCAITFIAAAGAYVYIRERFVYSSPKEETEKQAQEAPALRRVHRAQGG